VRTASFVFAALALTTSTALAQSREEPNLVFSIGLGLTSGRQLWDVAKQPLPVSGSAPALFDTVHLSRWLRPGIVGTLGISYYRSPSFGYTLEFGYFGLSSEQRCVGPAVYAVESEQINKQACDRSQGQHVATSVAGLQAGITYRFLPSSKVAPYVRVGVGPALLSSLSFITTTADVQSTQCGTPNGVCNYELIIESSPRTLTFLVSLAGGLSYWLGPAYRVRIEARDLITAVPVPTGPSDFTSVAASDAPRQTKIVHTPVFTFGLDVVLERRHTRRY
jgi:hypothetical protein